MIVGHKKNIQQLIGLANKKNLAHSYLFYGPAHTGKKLIGVCLANYLENKIFSEPQRPLSDFLEIDASQTKLKDEISVIEEIRAIKNFLYKKPNLNSYRMVLLDNSENLSIQSQSALLKISEEPTDFSLIILICRDPEFLLPTITSRFQKIYFGSVSKTEIREWLRNDFKLKEETAQKLAEFCGGLPGIAKLYLKDRVFKKYLDDARKFLKISGPNRVSFIKKIIEEYDLSSQRFNADFFLEILILLLFQAKNRNIELIKKILKMRMDFDFYNLNSKLQFVGLAHFLNNLKQ